VTGTAVTLLLALASPATGADRDASAFFEVSPTPQFLLASDRRIVAANRAAQELFSPDGSALPGRPFGQLFSPDSAGPVDALFGQLSVPGAPGQRVAVAGGAPHARPFPIELLVVRLSAGEPTGYGAIARDLRVPPPTRVPAAIEVASPYTLAELLMANRLRELV
jgi:PAS domain-containing protein